MRLEYALRFFFSPQFDFISNLASAVSRENQDALFFNQNPNHRGQINTPVFFIVEEYIKTRSIAVLNASNAPPPPLIKQPRVAKRKIDMNFQEPRRAFLDDNARPPFFRTDKRNKGTYRCRKPLLPLAALHRASFISFYFFSIHSTSQLLIYRSFFLLFLRVT